MSDALLTFVWYPILVLVLFCAVLHLLLVSPWLPWNPRPQLWWKKTDYLWLFLTCFSILGYAYASQRSYAEIAWESNFKQLFNAEQRLNEMADSLVGRLCGNVARRTEFSPPNFDEIVAQTKLACEHSLKMKAAVSTVLERRSRAVSSTFEPPAELTDRVHLSDQSLVRDAYREVVRRQDDDAGLRKLKDKGAGELLLLFWAPYMLAFAFALRITRATADVLFERGRN
ncbi:MAG: hypothetical protein EPO55_02735 [Reyranella sp.]|uniref:hypothetical protein n=1 Tax=Reyranella sp. TaxID=1929291 RepID=UPI00121BA74C|nr:hypothetical protein [Reyranella sp.]TAJ42169.1 MAG: hypothetical protein EPO55_02735 [Reyranella sp.]